MSLDARYDQERKACVCGCAFFVFLTAGEVHATPAQLFFLPPEDGTTAEALHVPVAECVQCRTRYDRLWREVV